MAAPKKPEIYSPAPNETALSTNVLQEVSAFIDADEERIETRRMAQDSFFGHLMDDFGFEDFDPLIEQIGEQTFHKMCINADLFHFSNDYLDVNGVKLWNVIDAFLEHRRGTLSEYEVLLLTSIRNSYQSLYKIGNTRKDGRIEFKDMITGSKMLLHPFAHGLQKGDIYALRLLDLAPISDAFIPAPGFFKMPEKTARLCIRFLKNTSEMTFDYYMDTDETDGEKLPEMRVARMIQGMWTTDICEQYMTMLLEKPPVTQTLH